MHHHSPFTTHQSTSSEMKTMKRSRHDMTSTSIISSIIVIITITTCSLSASSFMILSSTKVASVSSPLFHLRNRSTDLARRQWGATSRRRSRHEFSLNSLHSQIPTHSTTHIFVASRKRLVMMSTNSSEEVANFEEEQRRGLSEIGHSTTSTSTNNSESADKSNDNSIKSWKTRMDISIAKSRKIRGSNYVQLSTVDVLTCEPRCRTVVFRGFVKGSIPPSSVVDNDGDGCDFGDGCVMKMITDARSSKVNEVLYTRKNAKELGGDETKEEIRNNAELVWWFPKSSEQYRVRGQLQFIGTDGPLLNSASDEDEDATEKEEIVNKFLTEQRRQQWGNLSDMAREQFYWENPGEPYVAKSSQAIPAGGRDGDGKVLPTPDTFLLMLLYPTRVDYLRLTDNYHQIDERKEDVAWRWIAKRVNP